MAVPTVTQIVTQIAPIAQVLAGNDVLNGALFGATINPLWPIQIYITRKSCLWRYNGENISGGNAPSQTLINNSNYLYSIICGKYGQIAQSLINPGGVIPTPVVGIGYSVPKLSSYTAVVYGETVLELRDTEGELLPAGTLLTWVSKSTTPLSDAPNQYTFNSPIFTLINDMSMSAEEILSFQYITPVTN